MIKRPQNKMLNILAIENKEEPFTSEELESIDKRLDDNLRSCETCSEQSGPFKLEDLSTAVKLIEEGQAVMEDFRERNKVLYGHPANKMHQDPTRLTRIKPIKMPHAIQAVPVTMSFSSTNDSDDK